MTAKERDANLARIAWLRKRVTECNEGGRPDLANDAVNKIRAIERKMEAK